MLRPTHLPLAKYPSLADQPARQLIAIDQPNKDHQLLVGINQKLKLEHRLQAHRQQPGSKVLRVIGPLWKASQTS